MNPSQARLREQLTALKLLYVQEHYGALATEAAHKQWTHVDYLARLVEGEALRRQELVRIPMNSDTQSDNCRTVIRGIRTVVGA